MSAPQKPPRKSPSLNSGRGTSTNTYGRFNIKIKTLAGTSFQVTTYPSDSIRILKGRIAVQESLDPDYQHLLYHSREVFNYEIVGQIGLGEGSELTLVMTLRGGPVSAKQKFLSPLPRPATPMKDNRDQNEKRIIALPNHLSDFLGNDQVHFVLVESDGNIDLYQIEAQKVVEVEDDEDELDDANILKVSRGSAGGDVSSTAKNKKSLISSKQVAENRKTRVQMHLLQKKLANQRDQKRAELMAKQRASIETARRRIPSPIKPTPISSPSSSQSSSSSSSRSSSPSPNISSWIPPLIPIQQQWEKSVSYTRAVNTINLLRAEIILQSRRPNFHRTPGHEGLPYKLPQLERYVKSKLTILIEDEGYDPCFVPRACRLTPSVLITDESYTVSSASPSSSSSSGRCSNDIIIERKGDTKTKETVHYNSPNVNPSRLPFPIPRELQVGHGHGMKSPCRRRPAAAATPAPAPPPRQLSQVSQSESQRRSYCQLNNILAAIEKQQDYIESDSTDNEDDDDLKETEDDVDEFDDDDNDDDYWALINKAMELQQSSAFIKSARFKHPFVRRNKNASGAPTTTTEEISTTTATTTATDTKTETMISSDTTTLNPSTTATQGTSTNSTAVHSHSAAPSPKGQSPKSKSATTMATSTNCTAKRCGQCKRRLSIVNEYECRCGKFFCSKHRHAEAHSCTFDYKEEGRRLLEKANPVISSSKLPKI